jgi:hypothetical protein
MSGWDWDEFLVAGGVLVGVLAALALGYAIWAWRVQMRREDRREGVPTSGRQSDSD